MKARGRLAAVGSVALAVAASGCGLVLGLDDFEEAPAGGGGSGGTSPGVGGATSTSSDTTSTTMTGGGGASSTSSTSSMGGGPGCLDGELACDGGCTDVMTDPSNCGDCGTTCSSNNTTEECQQGQCVITSCAVGFEDCNTNADDGCEAEFAKDSDNCGACGHSCLTCAQGACAPTLLTGPQGTIRALTIQNGIVYWGTAFDGANAFIRSVSTTGGNITTLATLPTDVMGLSAEAARVYFTRKGGAIGFSYTDGSGTNELLTTAYDPQDIVAYAGNLFWAGGGPSGGIFVAQQANVQASRSLGFGWEKTLRRARASAT